jgi:hypothetical protein
MPRWTDQAPGGISAKRRERGSTLKQRLLGSVRLVDDPNEFAENDFRWSEAKGGEDRGSQLDDLMEIYINRAKFEAAGATNYEEKVILGESLHNLKNIEPERYDRMEQAALSDPNYRRWAEESYQRALTEGEMRPFAEWHRHSRFDQVIGGYLFAGDEDLPTMRDWRRADLPWGAALEAELKRLAKDLAMK